MDGRKIKDKAMQSHHTFSSSFSQASSHSFGFSSGGKPAPSASGEFNKMMGTPKSNPITSLRVTKSDPLLYFLVLQLEDLTIIAWALIFEKAIWLAYSFFSDAEPKQLHQVQNSNSWATQKIFEKLCTYSSIYIHTDTHAHDIQPSKNIWKKNPFKNKWVYSYQTGRHVKLAIWILYDECIWIDVRLKYFLKEVEG